MQHTQTAPLVFFSYAHEDEEHLGKLRQHLSLMQRQGMIRELYDRQILIIVDHVDWKTAPFGGLQALPRDGKPVTAWPNQSEAWFQVASGIRDVIEHLQRNPRP